MSITEIQPTTQALVTATLALCETMSKEVEYREYTTNILRKANALQDDPTASNVCRVLDDLRIIARLCGKDI